MSIAKRARLKINKLKKGDGTPAMKSNYHIDGEKGHTKIVRNKPKVKMSKKERTRQRWDGRDRFGEFTK
jgi:hypothetical protein